jgi:hypothetical protein
MILCNNGRLRTAVTAATSEKSGWTQAMRDNLILFLAQAAEDDATDVTEDELLAFLAHKDTRPNMAEQRLPQKYLDRLLRLKSQATWAPPGSPKRSARASPEDDAKRDARKRQDREEREDRTIASAVTKTARRADLAKDHSEDFWRDECEAEWPGLVEAIVGQAMASGYVHGDPLTDVARLQNLHGMEVQPA